MRMRFWIAVLMLLCAGQSAFAAADTRMQVNVVAQDEAVEVGWLHANIRKAADMALPKLWSRIIPQHAMDQIPKHVKAVRFLQKAVPNDLGVSILFNEKRVLKYLNQHNIPYYAEQSADNTAIEPQPTIDHSAAYPSPLQPPLQTGLLTIQRQASLPEQILFEDDLAHDPRIASLILRRVNRGGRQYRLQLKSPDDHWLATWFSSRGMTLTQSVEGWVARAQQ